MSVESNRKGTGVSNEINLSCVLLRFAHQPHGLSQLSQHQAPGSDMSIWRTITNVICYTCVCQVVSAGKRADLFYGYVIHTGDLSYVFKPLVFDSNSSLPVGSLFARRLP